jgi:putative intracellular protease/amidase
MEKIMSRILIVLTSHGQLGGTGRKTGFYWEELAAPYWAFRDAGHSVTIASITGGRGVDDPGSLKADPTQRPTAVQRFLADPSAMAALNDTAAIASATPANFDAVFLPGGHGTMWDLPTSDALAHIIGAVHAAGGVIGAVCHGPAGLVAAKRPDGQPLVKGVKIAAFTDAEEEAAGLTAEMPFLLETRLRALGASHQPAPNFTENAVRDGRLVTGQNPMSSDKVAKLFVEALQDTVAAA